MEDDNKNRFSVVDFCGAQNDYECGYCKRSTSCQSHGMWAHTLTVGDYQKLIDRGWRRSGKYCYKPKMQTTCCPSYTIRCDANNFKISKSQKKIIKKFNKFLVDGMKEQRSDNVAKINCCESSTTIEDHKINHENDGPDVDLTKMTAALLKQENPLPSSAKLVSNEDLITKTEENDILMKGSESTSSKVLEADPIKPPRKKAKLLRMERKAAKQAAQPLLLENNMKKTPKNVEKTLEMLLNELPARRLHNLQIKLVPSNELSAPDEYNVYRKYQVQIHKDDSKKVTQKSFENFLVRSPLQYLKGSDGIVFGSFHQQYWLDNQLIAVGVIDILPNCVSSVYFFYDPDYNFLSLGTYGSLREIEFTKKLSLKSPSLSHYYMGFYIHSCPKMIYKAKMHPSYLLCPEVYTWHHLDDEIKKELDEVKYQRFNQDPNARDVDLVCGEQDLDTIMILTDFQYFERFKKYKDRHHGAVDVDKFMIYATLVGKTLSQNMYLCK